MFATAVMVGSLALAFYAPDIARADAPLDPVPEGYACPAGSQSVRAWLLEYSPPITVTAEDVISAFGAEQGNRYLDGVCWAPDGPTQSTDPGAVYCPEGWDDHSAAPDTFADVGDPDTWYCAARLPAAAWPGFAAEPPPTTTTTEPTTTTTTAGTTTTTPSFTQGDALTDTGIPVASAAVGLLSFAAIFGWLWRGFRAGVG